MVIVVPMYLQLHRQTRRTRHAKMDHKSKSCKIARTSRLKFHCFPVLLGLTPGILLSGALRYHCLLSALPDFRCHFTPLLLIGVVAFRALGTSLGFPNRHLQMLRAQALVLTLQHWGNIQGTKILLNPTPQKKKSHQKKAVPRDPFGYQRR